MKLRMALDALKTKYAHAKHVLGEKKRQLKVFYTAVKNRRVKMAKWLLEKLLGSALISGVIVYGAVLNVNLVDMSFQMVYSLITGLSVVAYVLSVVLIPKEGAGKRIESPPVDTFSEQVQAPTRRTLDELNATAEGERREVD